MAGTLGRTCFPPLVMAVSSRPHVGEGGWAADAWFLRPPHAPCIRGFPGPVPTAPPASPVARHPPAVVLVVLPRDTLSSSCLAPVPVGRPGAAMDAALRLCLGPRLSVWAGCSGSLGQDTSTDHPQAPEEDCHPLLVSVAGKPDSCPSLRKWGLGRGCVPAMQHPSSLSTGAAGPLEL